MTRKNRFCFIALFLAVALASAYSYSDHARAGDQPPARQLKVAVAQPLVVPGDVEQNIRRMQPLVAEAARRGAQLVLFSECGLTGYDLQGVAAAQALPLDDPELDKVADMARKHSTAIVAGLHEKLGTQLHNTAVAFLPDGRRVVQRKHLIMAPEQKAAPIVAAARQRTIFDVAGFRCAILICSDDGIPGIYQELAQAPCDVILLPTAGAGSVSLGFHQAELVDAERRRKYLDLAVPCVSREGVERCLQRNLAVVACNQCGWDETTGYFHPGGSSIVDRTGEVTAVIPPRFVFEHLRPDLAVGLVTK
jgi:predicted amidohydrolase